jgi:hypothetical protein
MRSGSWTAAQVWARADLRSRWKAVVALGLIAGVTAGLALASIAGARSTHTALDRLQQRTNASDAVVFPSQVGASHPDWTVLDGRPEVRGVAVWALVSGNLGGDPDGLLFTPVDDQWLQHVDAPVVVQGRMFDADADDEVVVSEQTSRAYDINVGDEAPFTPYTPAENAAETPPDDLSGPQLTIRVVGIIRSPIEQLFVNDGFAAASPGLIAHHPDIDFHENGVVQLADPTADMPALRADVGGRLAPGAPVLDLNAVSRRVTTTTDVERTALLLLAAAIALAGLVLAGQVVARSASTIGVDSAALRGIGMRRSSIAAAAVLSHLPGVIVAAAACVGSAFAVSRWLPLGLAGRFDPDRGAHLHGEVVLPGTALLVVLLLVGAYIAAWLASGRPSADGADGAGGVTELVRRHASPIVGLGTTMALRRRRGGTGVSVRPALLGAIVGVLGVTTAVTMDAGLRDALSHPERAGVAWDGLVVAQSEDAYTTHGFVDGLDDAVLHADGVDDAAQVDRAVIPVGDGIGVPAFALRPLGNEATTALSLVTLSGHAPKIAGEAAIGPETARVLDLAVGDHVAVGEPPVRVSIVGTALFPSDVHAEFDEGVWLAPEDFDSVGSTDESHERYAVVHLADGTRVDDGLASLMSATTDWGGYAMPPEVPPELSNLRNVLPLPKLLAGFLALLAVAALLHVLTTSSRIRAHDFAVLRALGLTRRGTRLLLNVQGTVVFLVGLLFGIPFGVALGRTGWKLVARSVPLAQVSPIAVLALLLLVPTALLLAQLLAFGPGRRVAHLRPGEVLRTE